MRVRCAQKSPHLYSSHFLLSPCQVTHTHRNNKRYANTYKCCNQPQPLIYNTVSNVIPSAYIANFDNLFLTQKIVCITDNVFPCNQLYMYMPCSNMRYTHQTPNTMHYTFMSLIKCVALLAIFGGPKMDLCGLVLCSAHFRHKTPGTTGFYSFKSIV